MIKSFGVIHGWNTFRTKYSRTKLGAVWEVVNYVIFVAAMGPLFGKLFRGDYIEYTYYLAHGLVVWQVINKYVTDSIGVYISNTGYILNTSLSLTHYSISLFVTSVCNAIIYFLTCVAITAFLGKAVFPVFLSLAMWVPLLIFLFYLGNVLGTVAVFFRDFIPLVTSLMTLLSFFTPIIWKKEYLSDMQWVLYINPFYPFIDGIRTVSMGSSPRVEIIFLQLFYIVLFAILSNLCRRYHPSVAKYL